MTTEWTQVEKYPVFCRVINVLRVGKYTKEEIDYVRSIAKGRHNDVLAEMFNQKFNVEHMTAAKMKSLKANHRIRSGRPRRRGKRMLTEEQHEFLVANVKGLSNKAITDLINKKFNTDFPVNRIASYKSRYGISSGLTGRFEKGHKSWNKGKKGYYAPGSEKGWFKKGQVPATKLPVGSERINRYGYHEVKVADPNIWRPKHVIIWEKENHEVPDNHIVIFLDSNKDNLDITNLECISRGVHARMNHNGLYSTNAETTKAALNLVRLKGKIREVDLMENDREAFERYVLNAERNGIHKQTFIARLKRGWSMKDAAYKPLYTKLKPSR